ncbi:enoyl-[acyl-carrier-protein] reductase, mitochondrial isoform X4 [Brienomyrus brachyistius]|uniref:enoyl-[acyl-carrier-protein] reductase, mitochondrial isoform X4 n=1 Tax=Brienomyrus brachyistius TaxID=42636 RepID=UPI0020B21501|nr:enoyl-[acyl-carrier-protein] reductase, mitochondrial isoform X4 [Brienomyrus brachyistius]
MRAIWRVRQTWASVWYRAWERSEHRRTARCAESARNLHICSALVYRENGAHTDVLRLERLALAPLDKHCVRLKILAAPVNPADINMLEGTYPVRPPFPAVGGNEGVGEVMEVGSDVTSLSPGDWAIPVGAGFGTWRTEAVCDANDIIKVPKDISLLGAATIGVNPCTAYRMLHDFQPLRPGDTVIQNGANSAVGQAVIQIAAALGVKTICVIRDRPNQQEVMEELLSMGADYVVTEETLKGSEMDKIFQKVLIFKNITLRGFWMTMWKRDHRKDPAKLQAMVASLCDLLQSGRLSLPRCVQVPFGDYAHALDMTECAHQQKHVLLM